MKIEYTIGAELEFYILTPDGESIADLKSGKFPQKRFAILPQHFSQIETLINELKADGFDIVNESGPGQFEAQFKHSNTGLEIVKEVNRFKTISRTVAVKHQFKISFAAKPFLDQCGNGLHIHYSSPLFDPYGLVANNEFVQARRDAENDYILWAIGGMLARMKERGAIFFPNTDSHKRIVPYLNAPTKICWGLNNRSCAIRIPDSKPKRIEHRVAGADADVEAVINVIINDAEYGITNNIAPGEPIFGNAWDAQYNMESII